MSQLPTYDRLMNPVLQALRQLTRDGAPPIDLVDGDLLADKLKELRLGVVPSMIEAVSVDRAWFENI